MRLPARLLQRKPNSHKGDFGHILCIAGSPGLTGAAVLCSYAAMRTGVGLVTLGIPKGLNQAIIKIKPKEVMTLSLPQTKKGSLSFKAYNKIKEFINRINILIVGPGLTQNKSTQTLVRKIIKAANKPMIIDADGLNALVGHLNILRATSQKAEPSRRERATIITPHPGEMARLLNISTDTVQKKRKEVAKKFARDYKVTVVLKGHITVVADKNHLYINKTGNPGMSTAGSGDVLTGMIAALLGQGLRPFEATKYAVYLHGLAGDLAAKQKTQMGMIASDIIDNIPKAIKISS